MQVGIYLRISDDRDGTSTATERQRADCTRFAESKGWTVADVFEDIDLSAYKRTVKRPEFERMLTAVRERQIDGVLAWKIDRITRRQRDLVRLDEACEEVGGFIATVVENINTREPTGRFVAELLVAQARMESENASVRVARKHEERAAAGKPSLGGTRMFGYNIQRTAIIPAEAALIREATQRVLAGEGLRGICWDWRRRGIVTPTGRPWVQTPLRRCLLSAALSGQREHRGILSPGTWSAILTPEDHRRLKAVLNDQGRMRRFAARSYLLTGMLRCGLCGEPLVARARSDGARRYVCARQPGNQACGKIARLAEPIEKLVKEAVLIALDGVDLAAYIDKPTDQTDAMLGAIRADEEALQELSADYYAERRIDRAEFFAARDRLKARLEANRGKLAKANGNGMLASVIGAAEQVRSQWDERGLDWQRAVIGAVIDHIVIDPARKGYNRFDPALVHIAWRF
jgi:site-specific DNA recombinase